MPQVDLLREPFLPPDHEAALIQYSAVLGGLDLPSRSGIPFEEKFEESMGDLREPSLFVARQGWSSRGVATT
ncbi:MAG TPA: hypothetical protein VIJ68_00530, partial [Candidatus Saccharimonadales bacterium]